MKVIVKKSVLACAILSLGLASLFKHDAYAQEPRRGGVLKLLAPYAPALPSLDPHVSGDSQPAVVAKAFHRSLYDWNSDKNAPELELAKSVDISPDGLTYTYHLRDNVYFHHGRRMIADDIIWSYTRIMDPKRAFPAVPKISMIQGAVEYTQGQADHISGLKKIDDLTLAITFKVPTDPAMILFEPITAILPKEEVSQPSFLVKNIGLGPFVMTEHKDGSFITGKRFDRYYKTGLPYLDGVHYTITASLPSADIAFRNKELDVVVLTPNAYVEYRADPTLAKGLIEVPEMFTRVIGFNVTMKPLDDVRVRQAINYAINRPLLIDKLVKGKAFLATGWLPSRSVAFDSDRQPYPYDPAKAKALLAEAGYPNGLSIDVLGSEGTGGDDIIEGVRPFLQKVGINMQIKIVDANSLVEAINGRKAQAWYRSNSTGPDALQVLKCFDSRTSGPACNRYAFNDPHFDAILDAASAELNPQERTKLLRQADGYIFEQAPVWFFNYNKAVLARQPWVHNVDKNVTEAAILEVDSIWLDETAPKR